MPHRPPTARLHPAPLLAALALLACTEARMALHPTVAQVPALAVKGRDGLKWREGFTFGPWTVRKVDRGWTTTSTWSVLGVSSASASQKLEFQVVRAGRPVLQAQATTGARQKELEGYLLGVVPVQLTLADRATLAVSFLEQGETDPARALRLLLHGPAEGPLSGTLVVPGGEPVQIEGTRRLAGTSIAAGETTGYTFLRGGRAVGAVEVINAGRVFLDPALSDGDQGALAAASSALLLYRGSALGGD